MHEPKMAKIVTMQDYTPRRDGPAASPERSRQRPVMFGIGLIGDNPASEESLQRGVTPTNGKRARLLQRMKIERGLPSRRRSRSPTSREGSAGHATVTTSTWEPTSRLPPVRGASPGFEDAPALSPEEKELNRLESCYRKICTGAKTKRNGALFHDVTPSTVDVISYGSGPFTIRPFRSPSPGKVRSRTGHEAAAGTFSRGQSAAPDHDDDDSPHEDAMPSPVTKIEARSAPVRRQNSGSRDSRVEPAAGPSALTAAETHAPAAAEESNADVPPSDTEGDKHALTDESVEEPPANVNADADVVAGGVAAEAPGADESHDAAAEGVAVESEAPAAADSTGAEEGSAEHAGEAESGHANDAAGEAGAEENAEGEAIVLFEPEDAAQGGGAEGANSDASTEPAGTRTPGSGTRTPDRRQSLLPAIALLLAKGGEEAEGSPLKRVSGSLAQIFEKLGKNGEELTRLASENTSIAKKVEVIERRQSMVDAIPPPPEALDGAADNAVPEESPAVEVDEGEGEDATADAAEETEEAPAGESAPVVEEGAAE
eukprot:Opistho-1_new@35884